VLAQGAAAARAREALLETELDRTPGDLRSHVTRRCDAGPLPQRFSTAAACDAARIELFEVQWRQAAAAAAAAREWLGRETRWLEQRPG
jgi:hypothetical protein